MTNFAAKQESEDSPMEQVVRVIGRVKWFDSAKGYGFIVAESTSDAGLTGDVMLHVTCLRGYGESFADEGARIVCDAVKGDAWWGSQQDCKSLHPKLLQIALEPPYPLATKIFYQMCGFCAV